MIAVPSQRGSNAPGEGSGTDDLALSTLPPPRLGRRLCRLFMAVVFVQAVLGAIALILLQARTGDPAGPPQTIANLLGERLAGHVLHPGNPLARKALDSVASTEGVRFALILDSGNRVVVSSGDLDSMPPNLRIPEGGELDALAASGLGRETSLGTSTVLVAPIGGSGDTNRLVIGLADRSASRALLVGSVALASGLLGTLVIFAPVALARVRRSTGELRDLHKAIRRLAKGIPPDPIGLRGDNEVAYLGIAFNSMAADILAAQRALRDANALLEQRVVVRTEELRRANEALERNNVRLAEVTQTALRFTDDVAHEFRTPLAVILEFASIIDDGLAGGVTPEQSEHLGFIMDAARDLSNLVDDFLDTSRLRAGRLPVHRQRHSVEAVLDSAWKILEVKAADRKIILRRTIAPGLPEVFADLDKVRRILINLAVNAIKFSRTGQEVHVEALGTEGGVAFRVIDHGPGMSEADVARLFERFRQTSTGARGDSKGFGLGLSITAELVALNLGAISVESTVGAGSVFTFTLPAFDELSILRHCVQRARERDPEARMGALLVSSPGEAWDGVQLRDHIADITQPRDVQVPCDGGRAVLLVGLTDDIEAWRERILASEEDSTAAEGPPQVEVDVLGTWSLHQVTAEDLAALATAKGAHCG